MRALLAILFILLATGCGYGIQGRHSYLPADVQTIFIGSFSNATFRPFLENEMTNATTDRFIRGRALTLVDSPERADVLLRGTVSAYSTVPISYDRLDTILEYRVTMSVDVTLLRPQGNVLWRGILTWSEDFPSSLDKSLQEDNERAAIRVAAERLSDELYVRIVEDF
jgi:outer membrane lipopolysaccharide assembly protein LptE/RlpB